MPTFAELLRKYIERSGITDAELARSIGVRRQTIFRWKEGVVARPRHRDDVLSLAKRLRLSNEERDELLIVAGFAPESMPETYPSAAEKADLEPNAPVVEEPPADMPSAETSVSDTLVPEAVPTQAPVADAVPEKSLAADSEAAPVTIRLDQERDSDNIKDGATAAARVQPTWLKFLPIAAILLLVGGVGYWLVNRSASSVTIPAATVVPTRVGPPMPDPAAAGETLLLAALFENFTPDQRYNVAGRVEKELAEQISSVGLNEDARIDIWPIEITNEDAAKQALEESKAALLIWGEYDSGQVVVNLTTRAKNDSKATHLVSPEELAPTINTDVPQEVRILALMALGEHFLAEDKPTKAVTALGKVLKLKPPEDVLKKLHFQLGRAYSAVEPPRYDAAIAAYNKVLDLSSKTANAYYNRGLVYYNRYNNASADPTDLDKAIEDYSWMIERQPEYVNAYQNRGIAYYQRKGEGDLEAALADLDIVVEKQPDSYRSFYNRGLLDISLNRSEAWEPDLLRAKELAVPESTDYVNTLVALCWGYMLDKQFDSALSNCEDAIELAPDRGDSRDSLGIVYALNGNFDAAIQELELHLEWLRSKSAAFYDLNNGPKVEGWIEQLKAGEQPITDEVLESLRG